MEKRCGACDGCGVDGVLALVLLGFECERKKRKEEEEKKEETAKIRKKKEEERKGSIRKRNE